MILFDSIELMMAAAAAGVKPPERLSVSESAERVRYLNNAASYVGPWDNTIAPYLVEPMDTLASLDYTGMIFTGPARCGKSDIFMNWLGDTATRDPADMMIIHMSKDIARDWSNADLRRMFRTSKKIGATVTPGRNNMNVHDINFLSGMRLLVKWPTVGEVSGKTIQRGWINDHDRIENSENVDGEGPLFDLLKARGTTFRRHAMTVAESSPGRDVVDHKWKPTRAGSHEAPPCTGILSLYNRGDRRRWYWQCPQCKNAFEPDFKYLSYPDSTDFIEAGEQAVMVCPHCGGWLPHKNDGDHGLPGKHEMNLEHAKWIKDGMFWMPDGSIQGAPFRTDIASFWLKGPAAWAVDWKKLVVDYLTAQDAYERTGDEGPLRATINTGQGNPYTPKAFQAGRLPEDIKALSKDIGKRLVPKGVRWLEMAIDVQGNRFDVQTIGFGQNNAMTVIDRFSIKKSERLDDDDERKPLNPAAHPEDWHTLIEQVLTKTYELDDGSGRHMAVKIVACDSGGRAGVTTNAYAFWRHLRDSDGVDFPAGLHNRFWLVKGSSNRMAPRTQISYPDSDRKDRHAGARGEIPVMFFNPELLKDQLNNMLGREPDADGDGKSAATVTFPNWLDDWFWNEMVAETKTDKGWVNLTNQRNEAWDLCYYCLGLAVSSLIRWEKMDWADPPSWAEDWDENSLVFNPSTSKSLLESASPRRSLAELGSALA